MFIWIATAFTSVSAQSPVFHAVQIGDTWVALGKRYGVDPEQLQTASGYINRQREPAIGSTVIVPQTGTFTGRLLRSADGGLWQTAVLNNTTPWQIVTENGLNSPYHPLFYQPLFIQTGIAFPRDLPIGFKEIELSAVPARSGEGIAFRGETAVPMKVTAKLAMRGEQSHSEMDVTGNGRYQIGLTGTGAFYGRGEPELSIQTEINGRLSPLWSQPWQIEDGAWAYQELTYTGAAGTITQAQINEEMGRMALLWEPNSGIEWTDSFHLPIADYLEVSSSYGTRRSIGGGWYATYHEGIDYSAYRGTPVMASAAGTVVLAGRLSVRGNAVIIDHGAGVYTGMYHLSSLETAVGDTVQAGDIIGAVGTTGLSTGNHLHWDLIVNNMWVDGEAWLEQGMGCWLVEGLGQPCES